MVRGEPRGGGAFQGHTPQQQGHAALGTITYSADDQSTTQIWNLGDVTDDPTLSPNHAPTKARTSSRSRSRFPVIMDSVMAFHLETRWHFDQVILRKDERRVAIGFEGN